MTAYEIAVEIGGIMQDAGIIATKSSGDAKLMQLTARDFFAAFALAGLLANANYSQYNFANEAERAYGLADAMCREGKNEVPLTIDEHGAP